MTEAPEIWKPVVGFEGRYEVSDLGRVYSHLSKKFLRPGRCKSGHVSVALGRGNSRLVHHLVLEAFVGPRPPKTEGRHGNGVPNDNRLTNLSWDTRGRNTQDKKWHNGCAAYVLTGNQASLVKQLLREGARGVDLALRFGVAQSTISAIKHGKFHVDA